MNLAGAGAFFEAQPLGLQSRLPSPLIGPGCSDVSGLTVNKRVERMRRKWRVWWSPEWNVRVFSALFLTTWIYDPIDSDTPYCWTVFFIILQTESSDRSDDFDCNFSIFSSTRQVKFNDSRAAAQRRCLDYLGRRRPWKLGRFAAITGHEMKN